MQIVRCCHDLATPQSRSDALQRLTLHCVLRHAELAITFAKNHIKLRIAIRVGAGQRWRG
jgi:hypothetical protein